MGIFDKMKRMVTGPVIIAVAAPDTFSWTDESLAVTATLTNETDEPLTVAEVRFTLEARTSGTKEGATSRLKRTVPGPIVLDPGLTVDRTAEFPLVFDISSSTMERAATEAGLPAWTGRAMKGIVGEVPRRMGPHRISVTVKLDGSPRLSSSSALTTAI